MKIRSVLVFVLLFFFSSLFSECKKDKSPITVTDADGNIYQTITIGNQVWMAENLKTTRYMNGDLIQTTAPSDKSILNENFPKYQWAYNGDENLVNLHGRLYTWYAVTDSRGLAPKGWHIPTDEDWLTLETYMINHGYNYDGTLLENKIAKSLASTTTWQFSMAEGSIGNTDFPEFRNKSGFNASASGDRWVAGSFQNIGTGAYYWSASQDPVNSNFGVVRYLHNQSSMLYKSSFNKKEGNSVRFVKD